MEVVSGEAARLQSARLTEASSAASRAINCQLRGAPAASPTPIEEKARSSDSYHMKHIPGSGFHVALCTYGCFKSLKIWECLPGFLGTFFFFFLGCSIDSTIHTRERLGGPLFLAVAKTSCACLVTDTG